MRSMQWSKEMCSLEEEEIIEFIIKQLQMMFSNIIVGKMNIISKVKYEEKKTVI